ncbi:methyltransferase domain-containing protein [Vibrio mimicus]|uniref:class I SAM-dependent DNA methyltransferase n=1 Tax=Vibrio mimicus TaxID=674 RepID=UPI0001BAE170|nr:methyltransferase domain-containing protein [Vibrio mimicus]EEY36835.1 SAM-dependent methyltransferase [Vibrio mimicus MB451]
MAHDWDEYAANWENDPATHIFAQSVFQQLTKILSLQGKHILDFGCGTGLLSQLMSPLARDIVALDLSEAMIEELDRKELRNVEPVVDSLTRGLVAQHPAFRKQFDLVVASSVCAFLPNVQDVADIIFTLVDEGGYFIHFDWLADGKSEVGLSLVEMETVLKNAGFSSVETQIAFDVTTEQGVLPVMVGIARK